MRSVLTATTRASSYAFGLAVLLGAVGSIAGCLEPFPEAKLPVAKPATTLEGVLAECATRAALLPGYRARYELRRGAQRSRITVRYRRPGLYRFDDPGGERRVIVGTRAWVKLDAKGTVMKRVSLAAPTAIVSTAERQLVAFAKLLGRPRASAGLGAPFGVFVDVVAPAKAGGAHGVALEVSGLHRPPWAQRLVAEATPTISADGESYTLVGKTRRLRVNRRSGLLLSDQRLAASGAVQVELRLLSFELVSPADTQFAVPASPASQGPAASRWPQARVADLRGRLQGEVLRRMLDALRQHWRALNAHQRERVEALLTEAHAQNFARGEDLTLAFASAAASLAPGGAACRELRQQPAEKRGARVAALRAGLATKLAPMIKLMADGAVAKLADKGDNVEQDARLELRKRAIRAAMTRVGTRQLRRQLSLAVEACLKHAKPASRPTTTPASAPKRR
jgi:hypothetical protein